MNKSATVPCARERDFGQKAVPGGGGRVDLGVARRATRKNGVFIDVFFFFHMTLYRISQGSHITGVDKNFF